MKELSDGSKAINRRIDDLAREYEETAPHDPRRADIALEVSTLRLQLHDAEVSRSDLPNPSGSSAALGEQQFDGDQESRATGKKRHE